MRNEKTVSDVGLPRADPGIEFTTHPNAGQARAANGGFLVLRTAKFSVKICGLGKIFRKSLGVILPGENCRIWSDLMLGWTLDFKGDTRLSTLLQTSRRASVRGDTTLPLPGKVGLFFS